MWAPGRTTAAPANKAKSLPDEATRFVWLFCEARGIGRRQYMDEAGRVQEKSAEPGELLKVLDENNV